jgi:hypothetical protein
MADDFASAALRHESDARHLLAHSRLDNAGYLAGYGVECSFKLLVERFGGPAPAALGHDLAALGGRALDLAALLSPGTRRYRVDDHPDVQYATRSWAVGQRYASTGTRVQADAARLVAAASAAVREIVMRLVLDGLVPLPR